MGKRGAWPDSVTVNDAQLADMLVKRMVERQAYDVHLTSDDDGTKIAWMSTTLERADWNRVYAMGFIDGWIGGTFR